MVKIKALILAAGYGTRLGSLGEKTSKALLEVNGKPILEHILEKMKKVKEISEIMIVTNHRFYHQFRIWLNHYEHPKNIKLLDDGTISNETRLGPVGDLNFVLKEEEIKEDLLVVAGDNLFGFSLREFTAFFNEKGKSIVAFRDLKDVEKIKGKYGSGIIEESKLVGFDEKPLKPRSTLAATACYVFHKEDLPFVERFIEQSQAENTGDLVKYLIRQSEVHGFVFDESWFDVGSTESLKEAEEVYHT